MLARLVTSRARRGTFARRSEHLDCPRTRRRTDAHTRSIFFSRAHVAVHDQKHTFCENVRMLYAGHERESKTHHQLNKSANTARQKNKHASIMPLQCQAMGNFHASSDIGGAHRRHQTLSSKWHPGLCPSNCPATSLACSLLV